MYRSSCNGWLGTYSDIKHIVVSRDTNEWKHGLQHPTFTKVPHDD